VEKSTVLILFDYALAPLSQFGWKSYFCITMVYAIFTIAQVPYTVARIHTCVHVHKFPLSYQLTLCRQPIVSSRGSTYGTAHAHTHTHTHTYIHTCTHIHTGTHTCTHPHNLSLSCLSPPGWADIRLLAPRAELRLLLTGNSSLIDSTRLSFLGEALRALLVLEMRGLTVGSCVCFGVCVCVCVYVEHVYEENVFCT